MTVNDKDIKSKFHENKDWNSLLQTGIVSAGHPSRASSTKTRIETSAARQEGVFYSAHQEQVPRKQGLKHIDFFSKTEKCKSSRASSTKTRIETAWYSWQQRLPSRIKSKFHENKDWNICLSIRI